MPSAQPSRRSVDVYSPIDQPSIHYPRLSGPRVVEDIDPFANASLDFMRPHQRDGSHDSFDEYAHSHDVMSEPQDNFRHHEALLRQHQEAFRHLQHFHGLSDDPMNSNQAFIASSIDIEQPNEDSPISEAFVDRQHYRRRGGLKESGLKDLHKFQYQRRSEEKECSICCEVFQDGSTLVILPCMHFYHENCAQQWLKVKAECPCCKHKV
mmetsp:Transcript_29273/g.52349  ORF Transcript_29273/g.52349 Transcript_29273/m.52349 type:complete len:209 (-) Transcript_29273:771-1397(-)